MKIKYLSLLLAVVLCFGLAAPAFAYSYDYFVPSPGASSGYGAGHFDGTNQQQVFYDAQANNIYSIASVLVRNFTALTGGTSYLWDQGFDGQMVPMQYVAYALHGLKGTFRSSGNFRFFYPAPDGQSGVLNLGSDSKDYFYSNWRNIFSELTSTAANGWTIYTMSDNAAPSWLYQLAHHTAQSGISMETLMNWGVAKYIDGSSSPESTSLGTNSWFGKVQTALNQQTTGISSILTQLRNSNMDTSGLATEATLSSVNSKLPSSSSFKYVEPSSSLLLPSGSGFTSSDWFTASNGNLANINATMYQVYQFLTQSIKKSEYLVTAADGSLSTDWDKLTLNEGVAMVNNNLARGLSTINSNVLKLDEILATENDRALEDATDDTKVTVKDYVSDKKSNFGDSFTVGSTVTDGLKSDLSTAQASSAVSGLFSPDSGDYWGWFSSSTDSDLHPGASSAVTVSLDSEPSAQDVADSETVWVINPYASSSDLISDFFGGE